MNKRRATFCAAAAKSCSRGFTLVEVLAGSILLGTLLVTMLVANARLTNQAARAELRVRGCRIADQLLAQWWVDPGNFPCSDSGTIDASPGWRWQTTTLASTQAEALHAQAVRLSLFAPGDDLGPTTVVEFLAPSTTQEENAP
jgi:hypothetical protein